MSARVSGGRPPAAVPRTAGFTLIEVLVGLAVGGIVVLAGFAALATVQDRAAHAKEASLEALRGASARATLVDWLDGARLQSSDLGVAFQGLDAVEHALPADELGFPTSARTPLEAPITFVYLTIATDPASLERGLVAELVGALADEPVRVELVPQAVDMHIRYLPDVDGPVEWTESWIGQEQLPRAVELTLVARPDDPLPPLLRLPIRVPLATLR